MAAPWLQLSAPMMNAIKVLPVALVGVLAVVGCNRDKSVTVDHGTSSTTVTAGNDGVGKTTVTNANVGLNSQSAVSKIVGSRCAREQACNNVGVDKHYTNGLACTQKVSADMKDDLNAKDCPYGVDAKELNECLDAIQKEQCNNPIDSLSRIAACRTSDLCLKTAAPNH